jgi:hypothetical protein
VGPRAGLDMYEKSRPHRGSIPGPSSPYPIAISTELSRLHYKESTGHFLEQRDPKIFGHETILVFIYTDGKNESEKQYNKIKYINNIFTDDFPNVMFKLRYGFYCLPLCAVAS